ncbi:MAG: bifunctional nuclease family protein [Ilumatobacteraceae bacterium]|jgi:bifunctional DNase/RNase|nr:bifunctional nuclease family protein [Ilumatobacteraceae bacterium]
MSTGDCVDLELVGVRIETPANVPLMQLRENDGERRLLSIYIGAAEYMAIEHAVEGRTPPRPLTHDLLINVFEDLGAHLRRVVITEMRDHTYFAEIQLLHQGQTHVISCRPSDAVAIAVRADIPITASRELLDEVGVVGVETTNDPEEIIDEFRDFIDTINPEDFQEK